MSLLGEIEVRIGVNAWLGGASIIDIEPNSIPQTVIVSFADCVGSSEKYEVANIRLAPTKKEIQDSNVEFKIGDLVDLRRQQQNGRGPVWIAATVSAIKGDFYVCDFALDGDEAQLTKDVVDASDLRSSNPNGSFSISNLFRTTIELPPELHDFCRTQPDQHKDLQRACEAISVKYDNGKLIIVSGKEVATRVEMLKEFHIRNLNQKLKLAEKVEALNDTLEKSRIIAESISEKFQVDSDLLKYVLGQKGVNIQRARQVKGVIQISIDDRKDNGRATISIYAETEDAAKKARQILEFSEDHYLCPRKLVGRIIGQQGKSIQDIVDMSNILKAKVLSPKDATEAKIETKEGTMTVFKFIGTKNNIENAKALMDYLVNSHNELDLLMGEKVQLENEIQNYKKISIMSNSTVTAEEGEKKENRNHYR